MSVMSSILRGIRLTANNPAIIGVLFGYTLVTGIFTGIHLAGVPLLSAGALLVTLEITMFAFPFVLGGVLGLLNTATSDASALTVFVRSGKKHYPTIMAVYLPLLIVTVLWGGILSMAFYAIGLLLVGVGGVVLSGMSSGATVAEPGLVITAILGIEFVLALLVPTLMIQYYPGAVVIEDKGILDGFTYALGLFRTNLLRTIRFDCVILALYLISATVSIGIMVGFGGGLALIPVELSGEPTGTTNLVGIGIGQTVGVVLGTILGSFQWSYYTSFYRDVAGVESRPVTEDWLGVAPESAGTDG